MRIGLYLSLEHAQDDDLGARLRDLYEVVRTTRQAGFDLLLAGQHLLVPQYQYLQVLPILGRIAAESGDMEIGTDVLLLALYHPVRGGDRLIAQMLQMHPLLGKRSRLQTTNGNPRIDRHRSRDRIGAKTQGSL